MSINKFKLFILMVTGCLLMVCGGILSARADDTLTTIYSSSVKPPDNSYATKVGDWEGGSAFIGSSSGLKYNNVVVTSISANNVVNGRITTDTKKMSITLSGSISSKDTQTFKNVFVDVFRKSSGGDAGISFATGGQSDLASNAVSSVTFDGKTANLDVDFSNLAKSFPVIIGVRLTATYEGTAWFLRFLNVPMSMTATDPSETDSVIKGTGVKGNTVSVTIDGTEYTATVGDDGNYTIDLKKAIGHVGDTFTITQTASDGTGYTATKNVTVQKTALTIASEKDEIVFTKNDLSKLTNDKDVIAWIVKTAGITAKNPGNDSDTFTYSSSDATETDTLLTELNKMAAGDSKTINISATGSTGQTSPQKAIKLAMAEGTLSFGTVSDAIDFGELEVPSATKLFPTASPLAIVVNDTRSSGDWYVTATANPMVASKNSSHTLDLFYKDGTTQNKLSTSSTPIANSSEFTKNETTNIASDWGSNKGIFLQATPNTYADSYTGQIDWSLTNVPLK